MQTTTTRDDRPVKELVSELATQTSALVRQELELAKLELTEKGKKAGLGAGMLGGAGLMALFGLGALTACAILALATAVDAWLAALIVAVAYFAVAGVLALVGRKETRQATPLAPQQAIETTKEDIEITKARVKEARNHA
jgi:membrane protein